MNICVNVCDCECMDVNVLSVNDCMRECVGVLSVFSLWCWAFCNRRWTIIGSELILLYCPFFTGSLYKGITGTRLFGLYLNSQHSGGGEAGGLLQV